MGNTKGGVIWNNSDFDVKYYLASQVAQITSTHKNNTIDPEVELNVKGTIRIGGWKRVKETQLNYARNLQSY